MGGLLWLLVLSWACWLNYMDPLPIPRKVAHPLRAFDGVFRVAGPLLPFCVVVPRAFVPLPASRCVQLPSPGSRRRRFVLRTVCSSSTGGARGALRVFLAGTTTACHPSCMVHVIHPAIQAHVIIHPATARRQRATRWAGLAEGRRGAQWGCTCT